jgi:cell division protein FtsN
MNAEPDTDSRADGGPVEDVREFRLEGLGLVLVAAVLLASLSGAFYLGRWYESTRRPDPAGEALATLPGADAETRTKTVSAEDGATTFDRVGEGVATEPGREARPGVTAPVPVEGGAESAETTAARTEPPRGGVSKPRAAVTGPWTVQVAAVRDRRSAEQLYGELRDAGFEARIDTFRDGSDTVFKVRVGGFPDKTSAGATEAKLKAAGHAAWVTRAD